jgi:hypothetical protein
MERSYVARASLWGLLHQTRVQVVPLAVTHAPSREAPASAPPPPRFPARRRDTRARAGRGARTGERAREATREGATPRRSSRKARWRRRRTSYAYFTTERAPESDWRYAHCALDTCPEGHVDSLVAAHERGALTCDSDGPRTRVRRARALSVSDSHLHGLARGAAHGVARRPPVPRSPRPRSPRCRRPRRTPAAGPRCRGCSRSSRPSSRTRPRSPRRRCCVPFPRGTARTRAARSPSWWWTCARTRRRA